MCPPPGLSVRAAIGLASFQFQNTLLKVKSSHAMPIGTYAVSNSLAGILVGYDPRSQTLVSMALGLRTK